MAHRDIQQDNKEMLKKLSLKDIEEISIDETKRHWGYYNLDMIFGQMKNCRCL